MVIGIGLAILSTFVWLIVGLIVIGYALYALVGGENEPQEGNREQPPEDPTVRRESDTSA